MKLRTVEQSCSLGGIACPMGGGGGSSSSSQATSTTTNNTDKRMVLDGGAIGISNDGGNISTSTSNAFTDARTTSSAFTDARNLSDASTNNSNNVTNTVDSKSIDAGRQIALSGITNNSTNLDHLLSTADHLISQQQAGLQMSTDLTKSLAGTAQTAYADAANQSSGNKQLIMAAMAVVGVVAFSSLRK